MITWSGTGWELQEFSWFEIILVSFRVRSVLTLKHAKLIVEGVTRTLFLANGSTLIFEIWLIEEYL